MPASTGVNGATPNGPATAGPTTNGQPPTADAPLLGAAPYFNGGGVYHGERGWFTADYLVGWFEGTGVPPLVTTAAPGTPQNIAGILSAPSTSILFGNDSVNNDARSGVRLQAGYWIDEARTLGVEIGFMMLESQSTLFSAVSDGSTILARPFANPVNNTQQAVLVAFPGQSAGTIDARAGSGNFYEAHFDLAEKIWDEERFRITTLVGYRYYRMDDSLDIRQTIFPAGPNFVPGTSVLTVDGFSAHNEFHALDMGGRFQFFWDNLGVDFLAKLAVGRLHRDVSVGGTQFTTVPGLAPVTLKGGFLALSSNSGDFHNDDWTLMPELGLNLNWRVNDNVRLRFGYSVLFLTDIARAASHVDLRVNPTLLPPQQTLVGPNLPGFTFQREDVWLQTVNFGVEFTF